jgi:hypothetical protein
VLQRRGSALHTTVDRELIRALGGDATGEMRCVDQRQFEFIDHCAFVWRITTQPKHRGSELDPTIRGEGAGAVCWRDKRLGLVGQRESPVDPTRVLAELPPECHCCSAAFGPGGWRQPSNHRKRVKCEQRVPPFASALCERRIFLVHREKPTRSRHLDKLRSAAPSGTGWEVTVMSDGARIWHMDMDMEVRRSDKANTCTQSP